jgi:hypothetical protein
MIDPERTLFFNVALKNGHLMSRPRYEPEQEFIGNLIHELEQRDPDFAWIQFIFQQVDYSRQLMMLKEDLLSFKRFAETPEIRGQAEPMKRRKELDSEWYRTVELRCRKIDELISSRQVLLGIQGMWIEKSEDAIQSIPQYHRGAPAELGSFQSCRDELDSLAAFIYRDPKILLELVRRRFVTDINCYFRKYSGSRMEPPSLILASEDLGNYIHLPVGSINEHLSSLLTSEFDEEGHKGGFTTFGIGSGMDSGDTLCRKQRKENQSSIPDIFTLAIVETQPEFKTSRGNFYLSRMKTIPQIHQKLDTEALSRLKHLPSQYTRSFELLYNKGRTGLLIGSADERDLEAYKGLLVSIYGGFEFVQESAIPSCVRIVLGLDQSS